MAVVAVVAGNGSFSKRESTSTTSCCSPFGPTPILPITSLPGDLIGGAAAATAGVIPGIVGLASAPAAGAAPIGPVEPASGEGAGGEGGGTSAEASGAGGGSPSSKMIPEISLSIICLINGDTASRTAFFASAAAASRSFFASIKASWYKGVDMCLNS
jgi:hypothetical protein